MGRRVQQVGPKLSRVGAIVLVILATCASLTAAGQTLTSGSLSGTVVDQQGGVLAGVAVVAVCEPTGERFETTTDAAGRFRVLNARVGGPYTVSTTITGFADHVDRHVFVALSENRTLLIQLALAAVSATVEVTPAQTFDPTRTGTASNVRADMLDRLPTIQRPVEPNPCWLAARSPCPFTACGQPAASGRASGLP